MSTSTNSIASTILQYVRDNPSVTGVELQSRFRSATSKNTISGTLSRFQRMGLIENRGPGGPHSNWYPVEDEPVEPEYMELAGHLLDELKKITPSERQTYLARRMREFYEDRTFQQDFLTSLKADT